MRIHWYWPYSHAGTYPLVSGVLRPGDEVVVQALATRFGRPIDATADYEVVRDLPETGGRIPDHRGPRWALQRGRIYRERSLARLQLLNSRMFDVSCQHHLNRFTDWHYLPRIPERTALVSFVHDVTPHESRVPRPLEQALLEGTYRAAGELVVYHESLKSLLLERFDLDADRIHVVRHPLQPPASGLHPPEVCGEVRVLFFGVFRANKGMTVMLEAARMLRSDDRIKFHIAGRGNHDLEERVRTAARDLPNVSCEIGYIESSARQELFESSHVVLLPYTSMASQSGVLATAYSNALPVIVTDVGALGYTVREDGTGLVVPPDDLSSLVSALVSIASEPSSISGFCDAIHRVAHRYSHENVGASLRAIFDQAVERHAIRT